MPIQEHLEKFRTNYPSTKVSVESEYMVYKVCGGCATRASVEANELIESLGLEKILIARPTSLYAKDSFIVQEKR